MKPIKFVFIKVTVIIMFTFGSINAISQPVTESYVKTDAANKVQFIGIEGDYLIFDLRFSELPSKGCTLTITGESESLSFEEFIWGNFFARRYKIAREGMSKISFKASARNFSFNQSFTIKKEEKLVVVAD